MPNGPYVLRSPPNLFDNHLERRKLPRLQTGEVRRISYMRSSQNTSPTFIRVVQAHMLDDAQKGAEDGLRTPRH
jgi:hypothetical protein